MTKNLFYHRAYSLLMSATRFFFDDLNYIEVNTPLLAPDLIPESCLEVFKTERLAPCNSRKEDLYLIPSPEIYMKKIIAENYTASVNGGKNESIYQICKCFRNGESVGEIHNAEFTMLEYYTMNADYLTSLAITEVFFDYLIRTLGRYNLFQNDDLQKFSLPFIKLTMNEAFIKYARIDLLAELENKTLYNTALSRNINVPSGTDDAVIYDLLFVQEVEPKLKGEKSPVAILDYPAIVPCLAKLKGGDTKRGVRERWELYLDGVELANCYTEETDSEEVKSFFENEAAQKKLSSIVNHAVDANYYKIFENFPPCSGCAMGMDRVLMLLSGKTRLV
jgi:lysyl-tRNA synthetase class 2